jgi:hypothetical protein
LLEVWAGWHINYTGFWQMAYYMVFLFLFSSESMGQQLLSWRQQDELFPGTVNIWWPNLKSCSTLLLYSYMIQSLSSTTDNHLDKQFFENSKVKIVNVSHWFLTWVSPTQFTSSQFIPLVHILRYPPLQWSFPNLN